MKTHTITTKSMEEMLKEITTYYSNSLNNCPNRKIVSIVILDNIEFNEINASITYYEQ